VYTGKVLKILKKIDQKCDQYKEVLGLWLMVVILRIPNFFEPYWYGDEAIYLTIGRGLRQGLRLYTDIIDHKTPLIYYLAMVPDQFNFRLLNLSWALVTTALFFFVAQNLFKKTKPALVSTTIFVLLTTLPWLEGHIPNGELFVLGFVMVGLWLMTKTSLWKKFLTSQPRQALQLAPKEAWRLVAVGIFYGLAVLTKVPGILDFGMVVLVAWFALTSLITTQLKSTQRWQIFKGFLLKSALLVAGLLIPIGLSIIYFISRGSGQDYLDYGLLYNFRYAGSWQLRLNNPLLDFLFTLPGKITALTAILLLLSFWRKYTPRFQLIAGWLTLAMFAGLLSNRAYPHYFIQLVPAFSLLLVELWQNFFRQRGQKTALATGLGLLIIPFATAGLLNLHPFSTSEYYGKFIKLTTGQITIEQYDQSFNHFIKDNYAAAQVIRGLNGDRIFIWGTNPMLYALTQTTPTSRFTVSFHIKDFNDHQRTLEQIMTEQPKLIVVMKDETDEFPALQNFLSLNYFPNYQYEQMTLWLLQKNLQ
jgi:hypothetical protein